MYWSAYGCIYVFVCMFLSICVDMWYARVCRLGRVYVCMYGCHIASIIACMRVRSVYVDMRAYMRCFGARRPPRKEVNRND